MGLIDIRKFRSSKACYLLDLNGNILNEFDNLQCCGRFLKNKSQIGSNRFNNGSVVNRKYRIFTIDYYNKNKKNILKLKNYTRVVKERSLNSRPKPMPIPNYLCDLKGNVLKEFDSLQDCSSYLNRTQINSIQLNKGNVIKKQYRVFTVDFYNENKELISRLKDYKSETEYKKKYNKKINQVKGVIICDLFPNQEFTKIELAKKLKMTPNNIGNILNGNAVKTYGIKYKYLV